MEVGFAVGGSTKTISGPDALTTMWQAGDEMSLWALGESGYVLQNQNFRAFAVDGSRAFFSATLAQPMPEGDYSYYACYPVPESVSGTVASFVIPSVQDGKASGGSDIMLAVPARAAGLKAIGADAIDHSELGLELQHLLHRLRFYTDGTGLGGEQIQKLEISFPAAVAGGYQMDVTGADSPVLTGTGRTVTVELDEPLAFSDPSQRSYAVVSIAPVSFGPSDVMTVRMFTASKLATATIPLQGRTFAAGRSTPVKLIPDAVHDFCRLGVRVLTNNLGEPVQSITFTAPAGCRWSDNGSETFVYTVDGGIDAGHSFELGFEDVDAFRSLSGQTVTVTYDSEHVRISEQIRIGDLSSRFAADMDLNVPYLLFEDFSTVGSFSSSDAYGTANAGSKDAYSFLDGWTGGRVGAEAGHSIRIACRRETSANYPARVDSAPIRGILKKPADLSVEFDYGADNKFGGVPIIADGNVGQTCHIGYVTDRNARKSGDTSGNYESANSFYVKEYTGSYTSLPNNAEYVIHSAPAGDVLRISWRTDIESQAGTTNTTCWLYLDNVKVKISDK